MDELRALTIRQPWAWAIVHASKRIENRSRADGIRPGMCSYRGPLLIHASKRETRDEWDALAELHSSPPDRDSVPRGGIVGRCNVVAHVDPAGRVWLDAAETQQAEATGSAVDWRWWAGGHGLVLANVRPTIFVPCRGNLGLWTPTDETLDLLGD